MRILLSFLFMALAFPAIAAERLLVFAPSSMTEAIGELAATFEVQTGIAVKVSIAGTAQLARQMEAGAPADVFISADDVWMNWLVERDLVQPISRVAIAGNHLVIAVRAETENWVDAKALLTTDRFAMAEPNTVPAGRYAKQALESAGLWQQARHNAVYGENVRVTLARLVRGEVGAALVYASDVNIEPRARAALIFPGDSHAMIVYSAVLSKHAQADGQKFLDFLNAPKSRSVFLKAGFTEPTEN